MGGKDTQEDVDRALAAMAPHVISEEQADFVDFGEGHDASQGVPWPIVVPSRYLAGEIEISKILLRDIVNIAIEIRDGLGALQKDPSDVGRIQAAKECAETIRNGAFAALTGQPVGGPTWPRYEGEPYPPQDAESLDAFRARMAQGHSCLASVGASVKAEIARRAKG
jgi:hypothetical protein